MNDEFVELPVEVEVTSERLGTLRSVNVVYGENVPPELNIQE